MRADLSLDPALLQPLLERLSTLRLIPCDDIFAACDTTPDVDALEPTQCHSYSFRTIPVPLTLDLDVPEVHPAEDTGSEHLRRGDVRGVKSRKSGQ